MEALETPGIGDTCRMEELETPVVHLSKEFASSASHNYYKLMRELCICLQKLRSLENPCNKTWHQLLWELVIIARRISSVTLVA